MHEANRCLGWVVSAGAATIVGCELRWCHIPVLDTSSEMLTSSCVWVTGGPMSGTVPWSWCSSPMSITCWNTTQHTHTDMSKHCNEACVEPTAVWHRCMWCMYFPGARIKYTHHATWNCAAKILHAQPCNILTEHVNAAWWVDDLFLFTSYNKCNKWTATKNTYLWQHKHDNVSQTAPGHRLPTHLYYASESTRGWTICLRHVSSAS